MFFWACRESMRSTSIRLASLTWISTVPTSLTATSPSLMGFTAGADAIGWVVGLVPSADWAAWATVNPLDGVAAPLAGVVADASSSGRMLVGPLGDLVGFTPAARRT